MSKKKKPKAKTKAKLPLQIKNEDLSITVRLLEPIQRGEDEVIEELRLKKPKAKHLRKIKLQETIHF